MTDVIPAPKTGIRGHKSSRPAFSGRLAAAGAQGQNEISGTTLYIGEDGAGACANTLPNCVSEEN